MEVAFIDYNEFLYDLGFRRRSMSDLSKKGRPNRSYWIDNPASDEEHVEYKVYQIEDIESRITSPSSVKSSVSINSFFNFFEISWSRMLFGPLMQKVQGVKLHCK